MVALNFPTHFITSVMACISSTTYTLMINGSPTPSFQAQRGLRQGDPLSPLLFVIGMEYLSCWLKSVEHMYGFHPRCRRAKLSHLCFADDLMLFCKGDLHSMQVLYQCIQAFSAASGLQANTSKSAIYTTRVDRPTKVAIQELTQFAFGSFPFCYLGVPLSSKKLSIEECESLADKMTSKIRGWQVKHLSYAARLQLSVRSSWAFLLIGARFLFFLRKLSGVLMVSAGLSCGLVLLILLNRV